MDALEAKVDDVDVRLARVEVRVGEGFKKVDERFGQVGTELVEQRREAGRRAPTQRARQNRPAPGRGRWGAAVLGTSPAEELLDRVAKRGGVDRGEAVELGLDGLEMGHCLGRVDQAARDHLSYVAHILLVATLGLG